jgi:integrase
MARTKRYPGTIEQRGSSFRVILHIRGEKRRDGKRLTFTLPGTDRKAAEQFAIRKHAELTGHMERRRLGLSGVVRFSELLDRYETEKVPLLAPSTRLSYAQTLSRLRTYFVVQGGNLSVEKIRRAHIKGFLSWRRTLGGAAVSLHTVRRERAVLHAVFAYAEELEFREGNPVTKTTAPKGDPRDPVILDAEQYEALLREAAADPMMLHLFVLTMGETGARSESEVLHLRWEDVDLEGGYLYIRSGRDGHRTKSGKGRWSPMPPRLRQAMRNHFARYRLGAYGGKRTPYVFHHTRTRRNAAEGDRIGSLRRSFESAARRAKLPPELRQHDLRHRRVTTWLAEGKNPVHVKEAVGHADLRTTMSYTHLAREHLRALVDEEPAKERLRELGS